jgi:hypothetical protein
MPNEQPPHKDSEGYNPLGSDHILEMDRDAFQASFGESIDNIFDLNKWYTGEALTNTYERLDNELREVVKRENRTREQIRKDIFPRVFTRKNAPKGAGYYQATVSQIADMHSGILFNGAVEACDGIAVAHDSLAMTIAQMGVALVAYNGNQGTWLQRLYRRDLRVQSSDPLNDIIDLLDRRWQGAGDEAQDRRDRLSDLSRSGILYFGERATLLERSKALWRMGHGIPVPFDLLTGAGLVISETKNGVKTNDMPLLRQSMRVLRSLLGDYQRWVFVSKKLSDRVLLTFGDALRPLEYAIVDSPYETMLRIASANHPRRTGLQRDALNFVEDIGKNIVTGVYRASRTVPPCVFYAHKNFAHQAALLAMADSVLQEHRGFPLLLDLAKMICKTTFGAEAFNATIQQAYIDAGLPYRALDEWDK